MLGLTLSPANGSRVGRGLRAADVGKGKHDVAVLGRDEKLISGSVEDVVDDGLRLAGALQRSGVRFGLLGIGEIVDGFGFVFFVRMNPFVGGFGNALRVIKRCVSQVDV